ncbi:MAG TPA: hypothetical protein P5123_05010, partial [Spirochaetota bacterium]|nr:hypothetical protein [Spirochaetota bacterium]
MVKISKSANQQISKSALITFFLMVLLVFTAFGCDVEEPKFKREVKAENGRFAIRERVIKKDAKEIKNILSLVDERKRSSRNMRGIRSAEDEMSDEDFEDQRILSIYEPQDVVDGLVEIIHDLPEEDLAQLEDAEEIEFTLSEDIDLDEIDARFISRKAEDEIVVTDPAIIGDRIESDICNLVIDTLTERYMPTALLAQNYPELFSVEIEENMLDGEVDLFKRITSGILSEGEVKKYETIIRDYTQNFNFTRLEELFVELEENEKLKEQILVEDGFTDADEDEDEDDGDTEPVDIDEDLLAQIEDEEMNAARAAKLTRKQKNKIIGTRLAKNYPGAIMLNHRSDSFVSYQRAVPALKAGIFGVLFGKKQSQTHGGMFSKQIWDRLLKREGGTPKAIMSAGANSKTEWIHGMATKLDGMNNYERKSKKGRILLPLKYKPSDGVAAEKAAYNSFKFSDEGKGTIAYWIPVLDYFRVTNRTKSKSDKSFAYCTRIPYYGWKWSNKRRVNLDSRDDFFAGNLVTPHNVKRATRDRFFKLPYLSVKRKGWRIRI